MNKKHWYIAWGVLYAVCTGLSCITEPQGVVAGLAVTAALLFFLPPAVLLYRAIPREQWGTVRLIRNLSIGSLALTFLLLILNVMSVMLSDQLGLFLHAVLVLVSVPMVCMQSWIVSLFLWAVLLMVTLKYRKKK